MRRMSVLLVAFLFLAAARADSDSDFSLSPENNELPDMNEPPVLVHEQHDNTTVSKNHTHQVVPLNEVSYSTQHLKRVPLPWICPASRRLRIPHLQCSYCVMEQTHLNSKKDLRDASEPVVEEPIRLPPLHPIETLPPPTSADVHSTDAANSTNNQAITQTAVEPNTVETYSDADISYSQPSSPVSDSPSSQVGDVSSPDQRTHKSHWSRDALRHLTLATAIVLLIFGAVLWMRGLTIYEYSPSIMCVILLIVFGMACLNTSINAIASESTDGLDLANSKSALAFFVLVAAVAVGCIVIALLVFSSPEDNGPRVVGLIFGIIIATIIQTAFIIPLLDLSNLEPNTIANTFHASLLLACVVCCILTVWHASRNEKRAITFASAGIGAWSLIRGGLMLILLIEIGSMDKPVPTYNPDGSLRVPHEVDQQWKWPNEINPPLLDVSHPDRMSPFDNHATDPSFAATLPYNDLHSSVTQDQIILNVPRSYYFYLSIILLMFGVGVAVQYTSPHHRSHSFSQLPRVGSLMSREHSFVFSGTPNANNANKHIHDGHRHSRTNSTETQTASTALLAQQATPTHRESSYRARSGSIDSGAASYGSTAEGDLERGESRYASKSEHSSPAVHAHHLSGERKKRRSSLKASRSSAGGSMDSQSSIQPVSASNQTLTYDSTLRDEKDQAIGTNAFETSSKQGDAVLPPTQPLKKQLSFEGYSPLPHSPDPVAPTSFEEKPEEKGMKLVFPYNEKTFAVWPPLKHAETNVKQDTAAAASEPQSHTHHHDKRHHHHRARGQDVESVTDRDREKRQQIERENQRQGRGRKK